MEGEKQSVENFHNTNDLTGRELQGDCINSWNDHRESNFSIKLVLRSGNDAVSFTWMPVWCFELTQSSLVCDSEVFLFTAFLSDLSQAVALWQLSSLRLKKLAFRCQWMEEKVMTRIIAAVCTVVNFSLPSSSWFVTVYGWVLWAL